MKIYFESGGNYITAAHDDGKVKIRCNFEYTDCGYSEDLNDFVERHGGKIATFSYLEDCYRDATKI